MEWTLHEDRLAPPLGRNQSTIYFAGSMADLFHEGVPDAFVDRVLAVIRQTPRHTDLLLAPRAERLPRFFAGRPVPGNVGPGVTVEDRRHGLPCVDRLRPVPARVRCFKPWGAWGRTACATTGRPTEGGWRGACGTSGRSRAGRCCRRTRPWVSKRSDRIGTANPVLDAQLGDPLELGQAPAWKTGEEAEDAEGFAD